MLGGAKDSPIEHYLSIRNYHRYDRDTFICMACSVTNLGKFRKFLETNFLTKEAQISGEFWAIIRNVIFK